MGCADLLVCVGLVMMVVADVGGFWWFIVVLVCFLRIAIVGGFDC